MTLTEAERLADLVVAILQCLPNIYNEVSERVANVLSPALRDHDLAGHLARAESRRVEEFHGSI